MSHYGHSKSNIYNIYLIINVIFTLLENIFINFKVFLLIFDISIFIKKYPPIYLRYIRYIHKMQVPIYPSKPIFPTLDMDGWGKGGRGLNKGGAREGTLKKYLMEGTLK